MARGQSEQVANQIFDRALKIKDGTEGEEDPAGGAEATQSSDLRFAEFSPICVRLPVLVDVLLGESRAMGFQVLSDTRQSQSLKEQLKNFEGAKGIQEGEEDEDGEEDGAAAAGSST